MLLSMWGMVEVCTG